MRAKDQQSKKGRATALTGEKKQVKTDDEAPKRISTKPGPLRAQSVKTKVSVTTKQSLVTRDLNVTADELKEVRRVANQGECSKTWQEHNPEAEVKKISIGSRHVVFLVECGMPGAGPNAGSQLVLIVVRPENGDRMYEAGILLNGYVRDDGTITRTLIDAFHLGTQHTTLYRLNDTGALIELRTITRLIGNGLVD